MASLWKEPNAAPGLSRGRVGSLLCWLFEVIWRLVNLSWSSDFGGRRRSRPSWNTHVFSLAVQTPRFPSPFLLVYLFAGGKVNISMNQRGKVAHRASFSWHFAQGCWILGQRAFPEGHQTICLCCPCQGGVWNPSRCYVPSLPVSRCLLWGLLPLAVCLWGCFLK